MKNFLALSAVLLLGTATGFSSQTRRLYQSQFHVSTHKQIHAEVQSKLNSQKTGPLAHHLPEQNTVGGKSALAHRKTSSNNASSTGFVSATQIPSGGVISNQSYLGDFNGDKKQDMVGIVENYINGSWVQSISVLLSNGDGTFKPPVLTTVSSSDPIMVGDVNADGKDDILQVHPGSTPSTVDVWLGNGDGTFKESNTYQISPATLQGGILTDVNGDGKLDILAIDSQVPGLVRTLLNNGDGTFQPPTTVTLATQAPNNIVFADFNNDGKVDFAGLDGNNQVNIYLQEGGNFVLSGSPLTTSDSNYENSALTAGDLNGDGAAEIVSVTCGGPDENNATVYVNSGSGTFATGVYYPVAASGGTDPANLCPAAATVADVNGDGKGDIIVTNEYGGDVTVLLGNGDGTVKVPNVGYAVGGYPWVPAMVADFNGDGMADIMINDDEYSYVYLHGYGDGTFRAAIDNYAPINGGSWPEALMVATADFNGDGIADFAVANCCNGSAGVTIFLGRGDGTLAPGVNYGSGDLEYLVIADFNGDGKLDIAADSWDSGYVQILNGNGDGTFTVGSTYSTGSAYSWTMVTGDFNHDKHPDLAIMNWNYATVSVLLNDGTGGFLEPASYQLSEPAWGLAAGDINGDGYADLVAPMPYGNQVAILLGKTDNSGTFQSETDLTLVNGNATYWNPAFVTLADLNGDGKLDLAVSILDTGECECSIINGYDQGIAVALGNGDGTFQTPSLYSVTNKNYYNSDAPFPYFVQAADINGDGKPDLVYTNSSFSTAGVLFNNGNGTFGLPQEFPTGGDAYGFAIADVNSDGAPDMVVADDYPDGVTILLNANGSATQPDYKVTASTSTNTVKAGSSAAYDLTLTGKNGYSGSLKLSCSGLPAQTTCSFNPATVTMTGNSSKPVVLTITTTAASTADLVQPAGPNSKSSQSTLWASLSGLGVFGMVLAGADKKRRRNLTIIFGIVLLVMMFTLVGCSGNSSSSKAPTPTNNAGTPVGTYTVVVHATDSNKVTRTMNLQLIVK